MTTTQTMGSTPVRQLTLAALEQATLVEGHCRRPDVNPDAWFPERQTPAFLESEAETLCGDCPVRDACLELAIRTEARGLEPWGIWGGTTPTRRRLLVQARLREQSARISGAPSWHSGTSTPVASSPDVEPSGAGEAA
ncbi:WhiB family transcriptional regulator [Actinopolymorpha pittospori]